MKIQIVSVSNVGIRDSSVDIAKGHGLEGRGFIPDREPLLHSFQNGSGRHPTCYQMGTGNSFPGIKLPDREANYTLFHLAPRLRMVEL
jgi:hypothetical protein